MLKSSKFNLAVVCSTMLLALAAAVHCNADGDASQSAIDKQIDRSIAAMTLDEKISLLSGGSVLGTTALPRLGIPAFRMGDGPIGAHDPQPSTAFAAGIALAATWDRDLARRIGTQIGRDSRSRGAAFLLGPGVNIYREPMNGRNQEYMGEDPFLAGQLVVPYIEGLQSQNVTGTIKHYVGNESEFARFTVDTVVSERALREVYLPAFESAVRQAHVGSMMDSYNRLNGVWATENSHINVEIAKRQWGFDGVIMSDWIATHDGVAAANGGLDLEMPAGVYFNSETLVPAVKDGRVTIAIIDDKVRRFLRLAARFGWITPDPAGPGWIGHDPLDISIPRYNQEGRAVALEGALKSATLLKNENSLLPLDPKEYKKIAVIGPNAYPGYATGGGSGMVAPFFVTGPFRGISDYLGEHGNVTYDQGIARLDVLAQQTSFTVGADGAIPGVTVETFDHSDLSGKPTATRHEATINAGPYAQLPGDSGQPDIGINIAPDVVSINEMKGAMRKSIEGARNAPPHYARWTGYYHTERAAKYVAFVEHPGKYRLIIDGSTAIDHAQIAKCDVASAVIELAAGVHKVVLEDYGVVPFGNDILRVGINREDKIVHTPAIELAKQADAVVVSVGFDIETEGEGADREFKLLPGQEELIRQIAATNPHTIVVLNSGGSVDTTSWIDSIPALMEIWYSGEEGGTGLARILFGDADPSGRLPISWEKKPEDNPSYAFYYPKAGTEQVVYGDDIFTGYRGYEHNHVEPLFPFGYGLSYTTFRYSNLDIHPSNSPDKGSLHYEVTFDITNTGNRAGADVAQVYVSEDRPAVERPLQELKGFARVELEPGQTRRLSIPLDARSFAWYDVTAKAWHVDASKFMIHVSRSSVNPQLEGALSLDRPVMLPVE